MFVFSSLFRYLSTLRRIFVSHRVVGGDDAADDYCGGKEDGTVATSPRPPQSPALVAASGRTGGKDFSALLHSSAAQRSSEPAAEAEAKKPPPQLRQPRKGVREWILVIEGGLLIKQLDHDSAKNVDARLDAGLPILGCLGDGDGDDDAEEPTQNRPERIPPRDQWRGGTTERENEREVERLHFTHLFERLEVEMRVVKQADRSAEAAAETSAITLSGLGVVQDSPSPAATADVETFTWERAKSGTLDCSAFFVVHSEQIEFIPMGGKVFKSTFKVDRISAKIKLYRRQAEEGNYVPSPQLCDVFFPTFIGKRAAAELKSKDKSGSKSKKRKRSGSEAITLLSTSASSENDASNSSMIAPSNDEGALVGHQPSSAWADSHIPNTVTMDEALHAIFFYIRTRNLQDVIDLSVINNNEQLTNLFGCSRMLFSDVRGLLLEKQLLVKVEPCTHPIILNYDMTLDGAEPLTKKRRVKTSAQKVDESQLTTRRRSTNIDHDSAQPDVEQLEVVPHQTMLSCDVDIDIPNLFHVRTRDVLRRTKYREFEYTSSRIKALRSLVATKVDEETAKQALGDVVTGKGYARHHKQVLMAMAKGSHPGGEAQRAALIDLRTASLLEKLEEQCSLAREYWHIVKACKTYVNSNENKP
jgi:chromatin remodeling complex protein RSC6